MTGKMTAHHRKIVFSYVSNGIIDRHTMFICMAQDILFCLYSFKDDDISFKGKHFAYKKLLRIIMG